MNLSAKYLLLIAILIISGCNSKPSNELRYKLEMHNITLYSYKLDGMRVLQKIANTSDFYDNKLTTTSQINTEYEYTTDGRLVAEKEYEKTDDAQVLINTVLHFPDSTIEYHYLDGKVHSFHKEFRYPQGRIKSTETYMAPDIHYIQSFDYANEKLHRINALSPSGQQLNTFTFKYETGDEIRREIKHNVNENVDMPETSFYKDNKLYLKTTIIPGATSDSSFYENDRLVKMVSYSATGDKRVEQYKYDEGRIVERSEHFYVPLKP